MREVKGKNERYFTIRKKKLSCYLQKEGNCYLKSQKQPPGNA